MGSLRPAERGPPRAPPRRRGSRACSAGRASVSPAEASISRTAATWKSHPSGWREASARWRRAASQARPHHRRASGSACWTTAGRSGRRRRRGPTRAAVGGRDHDRAAVGGLDEPAAHEVREDRCLGEGGGDGARRGLRGESGTAVSVPERVGERAGPREARGPARSAAGRGVEPVAPGVGCSRPARPEVPWWGSGQAPTFCGGGLGRLAGARGGLAGGGGRRLGAGRRGLDALLGGRAGALGRGAVLATASWRRPRRRPRRSRRPWPRG